jgi:uncharacterized membrane protein
MEFLRSKEFKVYIAAIFIMPIVDVPWLLLNTYVFGLDSFVNVQGGAALEMRYWPAIFVYLATAYLVVKSRSTLESFLTGLCSYAIYDFTNLSVFKAYSPLFAFSDSLWGGILFLITHSILNLLRARFFSATYVSDEPL